MKCSVWISRVCTVVATGSIMLVGGAAVASIQAGHQCGRDHCMGKVTTESCYTCCNQFCTSLATACQDWCDTRGLPR